MSNQDDPKLGRFLKGLLRAEADEAAAGTDVPNREVDQRLATEMVARFGPQRTRRRSPWMIAAASFTAAAIGLVVLGPRLFTPPGSAVDYVPTFLPVSEIMGTGTAAPEGKPLRREDVLQIDLRPRTATSSKIDLKAFVNSGHGYKEWPVTFERFPGGALQLRRRVAELPVLPTGKSELVLVLCPQNITISDSWLRELANPAAQLGAGCQRISHSILFIGP